MHPRFFDLSEAAAPQQAGGHCDGELFLVVFDEGVDGFPGAVFERWPGLSDRRVWMKILQVEIGMLINGFPEVEITLCVEV